MSLRTRLPDRSRKAQDDMAVILALHHEPTQKYAPAGLAHQFDKRIERLADTPRAHELRRKVERCRTASTPAPAPVRRGKQRDVDEPERHSAMDIIAEIAVFALREHAHAGARPPVRGRRLGADREGLEIGVEPRGVPEIPADPAIIQRFRAEIIA